MFNGFVPTSAHFFAVGNFLILRSPSCIKKVPRVNVFRSLFASCLLRVHKPLSVQWNHWFQIDKKSSDFFNCCFLETTSSVVCDSTIEIQLSGKMFIVASGNALRRSCEGATGTFARPECWPHCVLYFHSPVLSALFLLSLPLNPPPPVSWHFRHSGTFINSDTHFFFEFLIFLVIQGLLVRFSPPFCPPYSSEICMNTFRYFSRHTKNRQM